jgi:hypothetical protein
MNREIWHDGTNNWKGILPHTEELQKKEDISLTVMSCVNCVL